MRAHRDRIYRREHRPQKRARQRKIRQSRVGFVQRLKLDRGCEICGYDRCPTALDFHHKDASENARRVADLASFRVPLRRIIAEIRQCRLLCRNCHHELTWDRDLPEPQTTRQRRTLERRRIVATLKVERGCKICGYRKCAYALSFHHRDPSEKSFNIGDGLNREYSLERIVAEIAKCQTLCQNCHSELHFKERLARVGGPLEPTRYRDGSVQLVMPLG